ncbi:MAG: hypothetical protein LBH43_05395 [Treponema sp.]|jgi:hypothetical protein|nr:hypothetical protein [Treponema sp.]
MKKIIVILSLFFVIAAGVSAVELNLTGGITTMLLNGNSEEEDITASPWKSWFQLSVEKTNNTGTAGAEASLMIDVGGRNGPGTPWVREDVKATRFSAWWQPIPQIYLAMGRNIKHWVWADLTAYNFQGNDLVISPEFGLLWWNGYTGSYFDEGHGFLDTDLSYRNLNVIIMPISGLKICMGWDLGGVIDNAYMYNIRTQINYAIPGAGTVALNINNVAEDDENFYGDSLRWYYHTREAGLSYFQKLGSIKFEAGLNLPLFYKAPLYEDAIQLLNAGIGFSYAFSGDFLLNARAALRAGLVDYQPSAVGFELCPSYNLYMFKFYLPCGIGVYLPPSGESGGKSLFAWSLSPYILKEMGGINLWFGFMAFNGAMDDVAVAWGNYSVFTEKASEQINYALKIGLTWAW